MSLHAINRNRRKRGKLELTAEEIEANRIALEARRELDQFVTDLLTVLREYDVSLSQYDGDWGLCEDFDNLNNEYMRQDLRRDYDHDVALQLHFEKRVKAKVAGD